VEFRLLGPVEAWSAAGQVDLGPRKQRLLLAVLALRVNRLVQIDRLVDLTWPSSPPETALHAIHVRVSGLRAALKAADPDHIAEIVTYGPAYMLRTDPMTVDAHLFWARVAEARACASDEAKVRLFRAAMDLWRGPPIAGLATPEVTDQLCRGLEETRLMAVEDCLDAELRLGRHSAVIDELIELTVEHPYREHVLAQLMLALYRAGRGPDALQAFLAARLRLVNELGLDPAPRLQALYNAILRGDPDLEPAGRPADRAPPTVVLPAPRRAGEDAPGSIAVPPPPAVVPRGRSLPSTDRLGRAFRLMGSRILAATVARGKREGDAAMASVMLEAVKLTKRYGSRTAVEELSFSARQGEVLGLLGANGAGKTTTVRLLTTILTPTSGEFSVAGVPSTNPTEIRRRVGVLPESAGYPGHQTGLDYLAYQARLYGLNRSDAARVSARALAEVGLDRRASSRISTYSRGMRQRLGIARALLNQPAAILLDEPTLGLDPAGQRQVLDLVRDVVDRSGATVVLSTHALPDVEEICTRVLILDAGRIAMSGTVGDVTRAAASRRGAALRVPVELAERATAALAALPGVTVEVAEERPDLLKVVQIAPPGADSDLDIAMNAALQAVLSAGVPVLSYEVEGARLSDAFLALTGGVR
jgi:ABC-2 type transport system ATP-binding protein